MDVQSVECREQRSAYKRPARATFAHSLRGVIVRLPCTRFPGCSKNHSHAFWLRLEVRALSIQHDRNLDT
jgi:hypothetical protein